MGRSFRFTILVTISVLASPQIFASAETDADRCPDLRDVPGTGLVCPLENGLFEVYAPDGRSLGFTHGQDPRCDECPEPVPSVLGSTTPHCVDGAAGTYYVHVIYARAHNDADRYSTMVGSIRSLVQNANAMVDDAAIATGDNLAIRVLCSGSTITVENVVLPTSMSSASFSTIVNDLRNMGYDDHRQKYWVYYDDAGACVCAGQGHIYNDDSNSVNNYNNGYSGAVPMFAVSYNSNSVRTMLHELGHNIGAVQNSAPYTTGAGHCYDGRDTMCYNDGGPNGHLYSTTYCAVEVFDCNKNTYCHANPAAGSYLATKWQACSRLTRFLQYPANVPPVMEALSCSPTPSHAEESVSCTFRATDSNTGVYYTVNWGDGSTTRVPASGTVAPGTTQGASHTWASQGDYTVSVTATDNASPAPGTSTPLTLAQQVLPPNVAPTLVSYSCAPTGVAEGETVTCTFTATDASHNVSYNMNWGDGTQVRIPASGFLASGTQRTASHAYGGGGTFTASVTATDDGRPPKTSAPASATISVTEINSVPVMAVLSCPGGTWLPGASVPCSFSANDDSSGVRYRIEWGDGSVEHVPSSGYTAPGVSQSRSHAYAVSGTYQVNVSATDNDQVPLTSAALSASIHVEGDMEGPALSIREPLMGYAYFGCEKFQKLAGPPLYVVRGCVKATATDASGVARVEVRYQGQVIATDTNAPYDLTFSNPTTGVMKQIEVRAIDTKGNHRSVQLLVDMV